MGRRAPIVLIRGRRAAGRQKGLEGTGRMGDEDRRWFGGEALGLVDGGPSYTVCSVVVGGVDILL